MVLIENSPGLRSTDARSRGRYSVTMGCTQDDGCNAAARAQRGRRYALSCCRYAMVVFPRAVWPERRKAERDHLITASSGLIGPIRHSTTRNGTVRHACQVVPFAVAECRMVPGGVASSRGAFLTDQHATDSGGRIVTGLGA